MKAAAGATVMTGTTVIGAADWEEEASLKLRRWINQTLPASDSPGDCVTTDMSLNIGFAAPRLGMRAERLLAAWGKEMFELERK